MQLIIRKQTPNTLGRCIYNLSNKYANLFILKYSGSFWYLHFETTSIMNDLANELAQNIEKELNSQNNKKKNTDYIFKWLTVVYSIKSFSYDTL